MNRVRQFCHYCAKIRVVTFLFFTLKLKRLCSGGLYNYIGILCTCANGLKHFCVAFLKRKINIKFWLASLQTLTNYMNKHCSESRIRTSDQAFLLCHWSVSVFASLLLVDFLQCTHQSRLPEQFSGSQAAISGSKLSLRASEEDY
jgi:hypothetical protein